MPNLPMTGFPDGFMFSDMEAEMAGALEEQIFVKRFTGVTGGDQNQGINPTKTYITFKATMLQESLSAAEIASGNGIYQMGDIKAQITVQIFGGESGNAGSTSGDGQTPGRYSDAILYRGREYKIVGHVQPVHLSGQIYYSTVLRQEKA